MKMFNIKNTILACLLVLLTGSFFLSCEDDLEEKFYDPEKLTEPNFEMLFAGALQPTELFRLEYGPNYHFIRNLNRLLGLGYFPGYTGSGLNERADNSYPVYTGWSGGQLRNIIFNKTYVDFYKNIPVMTLLLNGMSAEEQKNYEVYLLCVNIVKAYMYQRLTDIYDDVPFTEAGGAFQNQFYAKYDSQQSIYHSLLDSLAVIADKLHGMTLNNSLPHQNFPAYDLLNEGSLIKWEKFANSMRLRMAIRLSVIEPDYAKSVIADIISNNQPLVSEPADFIGMAEKDFDHLYEYYWPRAFYEVFYNCHAPYFLVHDVFGYVDTTSLPEDVDPRLYVVFQPNVFGNYIGLKPWSMEQYDQIAEAFPDTVQQETVLNYAYNDYTEPYFSMYNAVTYLNYDAEYPAFTPSETHLLLAEAALRFPDAAGSIDVVEHYRTAISQSIDYYYDRNNNNKYSESTNPNIPIKIFADSKPSKPSPADIESFLTKKSSAFNALSTTDKIREIFYQKFAHLNIYNHWEIWSEARRLSKDYGLLTPTSTKIVWIERFQYPEGEPAANPDNFKVVAGQNDVTTPVWWTGRKQ